MTPRGHAELPQFESDRPDQRPRRGEAPPDRVASDGRLGGLSARGVLALQRGAGNAAVGSLLGRAPAAPVVQTYVNARGGGRRSDDGNILKKSEHELYAVESLVDAANVALQRPNASHIGLGKQPGITSGGKALTKVVPAFHHHPGDAQNAPLVGPNTPGNLLTLWADCGRSSRVVMGVESGKAPRARYTTGGAARSATAASTNPANYSNEIYLATMPAFIQAKLNVKYLKKGVHYNGEPRVPILPANADQAREQYIKLPPAAQKTFDKYAHINTGANPDIGGGYTMNTEYNMPGSAEVPGRARWNFHWAGVVLKDGGDNVTLENYAVGDYNVSNQDWNFEMYGTAKKGQTFHEEHLATGTHGTRASTFEVEPSP